VNILNIMTQRFLVFGFATLHYWVFWVFILLSLILFGRFYCGWICPFGFLQEVLKLNKVNSSPQPYTCTQERDNGGVNYPWPEPRTEKQGIQPAIFTKMKYFLVWIAVFFALLFDNPNLANYEPLSAVFGFVGSPLIIALSIVTLAVSFFHNRFFCKYFCPVGAVLGLCSIVSVWKLKVVNPVISCPAGTSAHSEAGKGSGLSQSASHISPSLHFLKDRASLNNELTGCNECGKCIMICPVSAIEKVNSTTKIQINNSECIQCNKCKNICTAGAIKRSIKG